MVNDVLHPVSYHLRNFGQYLKLDLEAASDGNLTLLGANAVGKTTLANAFYPVLIDGSIATPNFNPARSSDAVGQSINPRNTTRDKRTFNSMLLGWGPSQFAIRTGYTYAVFASSKRQVLLGIGAHRQKDGKQTATWWFVIESARLADFRCCDDQGETLAKQDFIDANAGFGEELQVFDDWKAYRAFVATHVYGFDNGEALGKLANAYRLLASPILTGGNARFAPIPNALRMAQEPIDRAGIIEPLAMSQRNLNQTLALQHELQNGLNRLEHIQRSLFWGNLNHLNDQDGLLPKHTSIVAKRDQADQAVAEADRQIKALQPQLEMAEKLRDDATDELEDLQKRVAEQDSLKRLREGLDAKIADWRQQLATFERQQAEKTADEALVATRVAALATLVDAAKALQADTLDPLIAKLHGLSANHTELTQALAQTDNDKMRASLQAYLTQKQRQLKDYQNLLAAIKRTSDDVALVVGMQNDMGEAIDTRLAPRRFNGVKTDLNADNQRIHEAGAAAMNAHVTALQAQQQALLKQAPDLVAIVRDPELLTQLQALFEQLSAVMKQLAANQHQQDMAQLKLNAAKDQLAKLIAEIDADFDPEVATTQIDVLLDERDQLQIDPTLGDQVAAKKKAIKAHEASIRTFSNQLGNQSGIARSQADSSKQATAELVQVDQRLDLALATLRQFAPESADLSDILATLAFAHSNGAMIREHPYNQMGEDVRNTLTGGVNEQPIDALFDQREAHDLAASLHEARTVEAGDLLVVPFDLKAAIGLFDAGLKDLQHAVEERESGQDLAMQTYLNAASINISQQYQLIPEYNQMLTEGIDPQGIRLAVDLVAIPGSTEQAVAEACDLTLKERPALSALVQSRIDRLVNDPDLASDQEAFIDAAVGLLDTRLWSEFKIYIYRRHSEVRELVNDAFVQSGGSGAEKAQAMVLPLLLVPKMRLRQAAKVDAPYLVMFDEFADKLDPDTARAFAQTIARFGFNFIATMPSGAQTKILADGVANRAYEVLAPKRADGKFHANQVHEVMQWHAPNLEENDHE